MSKVDSKKFPTLAAYLDNGSIWIDADNSYVGKASDGTMVQIGTVGFNDKGTESYLVANPTPDTW